MQIDLRSDTVTQPSAAMKEFMMQAPLGDDVFAEDPSVNQLEAKAAELFGREAAIYCPSGTMTNQIAIKLHTRPLDEVITDKLAHIYNYEVGGYAYHSSVSVKLLEGDRGRLTADQIKSGINPEADWLPNSSLVVLENTCNKGGGSYYNLQQLLDIQRLCKEHSLKLHLDGARIFNALEESKITPKQIGEIFDTVSVCLSKGVGAPVGSVLIGDKKTMKRARKVRKVMGGGMRQSGILAAACIYALDNNLAKLKEDHRRAKTIEESLRSTAYVADILPVDTNILIFRLIEDVSGENFIQYLSANDIKAIEFSPQNVRFVTHLDFTDEMLQKTITVLKSFG